MVAAKQRGKKSDAEQEGKSKQTARLTSKQVCERRLPDVNTAPRVHTSQEVMFHRPGRTGAGGGNQSAACLLTPRFSSTETSHGPVPEGEESRRSLLRDAQREKQEQEQEDGGPQVREPEGQAAEALDQHRK